MDLFWLTMAIFSVWIINKAGGLIYQRNYAGETQSLPGSAPNPVFLIATPNVFLEGLAQLTSNEYLVMAGTLHGVHAITSKISPVSGSSGVQSIEAETFKMNVLLTLTGEQGHQGATDTTDSGSDRRPCVSRASTRFLRGLMAIRHQIRPDHHAAASEPGPCPAKNLRGV